MKIYGQEELAKLIKALYDKINDEVDEEITSRNYTTKTYVDTELSEKADKEHGTHLTLGTTSSTAYRGDYGNTAYNHSQSAHAPSNAQKNSDITKAEIEAKLTGTITSHNHSGVYAPVSHGTHLTLGTTSSTAYRGDYGNTAYTHSQAAHAPSNAQKNSDITKAEIEAKLTGTITSHSHTIANITDLRLKNGVSGVTMADPYQTWASADINENDIIFGASYSGHTTTDANIVFSSGNGKINMIIDGEYYAAEGKQRVYHTGYKPTPADIGAAAASHGTHLTIGTGASNAAAGNHTHNYAGSSSAGGAATSANKVNTNLVVKLNSGTTEGTNLFTFNGSTAKTINITPSSIGAAASSHGTHLSLGTTSSTAYRGDYGNTAYTHSQAAHAPSNAQKNSDITKAEIEAKLTGTITSHNHSGTYAPASHNHTSLTGITSLTFDANSDDSSIIQITKDSATSYTDFIMSDDAGSDMWRWRFKAWDSSASALTAEYNLMTLKATSTTKGQLSVNGNITADSFTEGGTALSSKYAAASHGTHLTIGTGASNAAAGNHTHNYAGSSSAGGAANSVKTNLIIKLNSGTTEGTNLFTFNGSTAKTINITPANIGAAASSHGTHLTLGTTSSTAYRGDYGNTAYTHSQAAHAPSNAQKNSDITKAEIEAKLTGNITSHTHNYAGSSSAGGAANSVKTNLIIKLNGGTTEGTNLFTFNGSTAKTIDITPSSIGAAASSHGTHVTWATSAPKANGTAAVGTVARVAREDHVHPLQTTMNGYSLWSGTKAEYDAITSKSSTTLYFIKE